ncbi:hypothetical protein BT69DRAFT_1323372 [Atractiella rhizophila]|nr:hypothetical protein BT69DRAFT_1270419 [Atractiella rhizophila]KAH8917750.1 hypothetical protein BT69DRAFT_1323372 [Atractiella rhizophila]
MAENTIQVSNLSPTTTKESLEKFLGFCGKVNEITIDQDKKSASVTFEKETSARTAAFLNGGTLDGSVLNISGPAGDHPPTPAAEDHDEVGQHDKPRTAIVAEYLAHGYVLGDQAIHTAISQDQKYGISQKFLTWWNTLNEKAQPHIQKATETINPTVEKATTQAKSLDEKGGVSSKGQKAWDMSVSYYQKALSSPYGQKVSEYYTKGAKTVLEVHEEAKRIAEEKKAHGGHAAPAGTSAPPPTAAAEVAPAAATPSTS